MIDPYNPDFKNTPSSTHRPSFNYAPFDSSTAPYVSIVTPFYNTAEIFNETAKSIQRQSFQQWEWLIINDGSNDPESLSILNDFRRKDPRIKVIDHEVNKGLSATRNTGFRSASSEYIVQLDSDDLLETTAVEKWFWFLESYPEYAFCKGYSVGFGAQEYLWDKGFHFGKTFRYVNLVAPTSMIRKHIHTIVNGYDESIRQGLEDWDFWLRCASKGYWGGNIPEYLDWYRRRAKHHDRWSNWDNGKKQRAFRMNLRKKYNELWNGKFPEVQPRWHFPYDDVPDELPCKNRLKKDKPRLLMIVPWLSLGGADKFNLDLVQQLMKRGWEITIATTLSGKNSWLPQFAKCTPDIFVLHNFLHLLDYPRFLRYLIQSRQIDAVVISHSELGYLLLPYFRSHFPEVAFIDLCHIEEEYWKNGGYPRMAVDYQEALDLNVVVSEHLKAWMTNRGADQNRVFVCHVNVDTDEWHPDSEARAAIRKELGIAGTTPVILYAGRLCAQKQPIVFAKTIQKLAQTQEGFVAIVAGDGQELKRLKRFTKKNKLIKWVRFLGAVPNERIKLLMASSDIFFLPSKWEGIALTIYEAMAMELPVVGADVGGQRELVTPECGILIRRSNEETEASQYSEILLDLLKNPQRGKTMGKAGRERIRRHFTLDQMVERMICLIEKAKELNKNNPRPSYTRAQGRTFASQAIELVRLSQSVENLWAQAYNPNWRLKFFHILRNLGEPLFQWAVDRGWTWQFAVSSKIKRVLLKEDL